ncbi:MAG: hypothetical protein WAW10_05475 [Gallionella sp.]
MEENTKKKSPGKKETYRRPFTVVDWIIAAFSAALLVYILINIPAY